MTSSKARHLRTSATSSHHDKSRFQIRKIFDDYNGAEYDIYVDQNKGNCHGGIIMDSNVCNIQYKCNERRERTSNKCKGQSNHKRNSGMESKKRSAFPLSKTSTVAIHCCSFAKS